MNHSTLFIQRSAQTNLSPQGFSSHPETIYDLLKGGMNVNNKLSNVKERNAWSSSVHQEGKFSYRITICLPPPARETFSDFELSRVDLPLGFKGNWNNQAFIKRVPLNEINVGVYKEMFSPNSKRFQELLPYIVVYGGTKDGNEPLTEVWMGEKAKELIAPHEEKENTLDFEPRSPEQG